MKLNVDGWLSVAPDLAMEVGSPKVEADHLDGEEVLPGFRYPTAELFPPRPPSPDPA